MNSFLFNSLDYKAFIKHQSSANKDKRGYQGQMAHAAGIPRSYFSRVLNSKAHLNGEQAIRLTAFWSFSELETEYFLELVTLGRTEFPPLIKRTKKRLQALKLQVENISKRFSNINALDQEKAILYYSTWHPLAIHVLVGIPGFETVETIARHLKLSPALVTETLAKLEGLGLVQANGRTWKRAPGHLHLSKDSPLISVHHSHWHYKAIQALQDPTDDDSLHYTLLQSHSHEDFYRIKQIILSTIDESRKIMLPSPPQEMTCLCFNFFRV